MRPAFLIIILALTWAGITGNFSGLSLLFGGLIGTAAILLLRHLLGPRRVFGKAGLIILLFGMFLYELMASAVRVALIVIRPNIRDGLQPAIVPVPLTVKTDAEITLLANLITLTPGTLSIDLAEDRSTLFVHVLTTGDQESVIADIKNGFEKRVLEVFR